MGLSINKEHFTEREFQNYSKRLYECLEALKQLLHQPHFDGGVPNVGAELELYIVDKDAAVMPINKDLIESAGNPQYTIELNQFNLEINLEPETLDATVFSRLQHQLTRHIAALQNTARQQDAQVVPIGILPTLQNQHLTAEYMTDSTRYRALSRNLFQMRGQDFHIHIKGQEELQLTSPHVTLEGANTSFQFHLMVPPQQFAEVFNAAQLTLPLVVALAANSPVLLGKQLWDETRIALFKQSIDSRTSGQFPWRQPSRVSFGHGWVRDSSWELFAETVALYPPMFPVVSDQGPLQVVRDGGIPKLEELSLHMGTTWPWNRPVYSHLDGGHVRIEMRALPAGPSNLDLCANAAFATGLAFGLRHTIGDMLAVTPFQFAEYNFYRAAQSGLDAQLIWSAPGQHRPVETPVPTIVRSLLPVAEAGLQELGIDSSEIARYLGVIQTRLDRGITGARWQRHTLEFFERRDNRQDACRKMTQCYIQQQQSGLPVTEWELL